MTIFNFLLLFLLAGIAAIAGVRIIHTALSLTIKIVLLSLRVLLVTLIALAFFEPVLVFEQLPAQRGSVPVLIDASKSMRLFLGDSAITRTLARLDAWNSAGHGNKNQKFILYAFGDSLIPLKKDRSSLRWSNRRSYLPATIKDDIARRSNTLLLISDGNWSNATLPAANFADKNVFYLPLKRSDQRPYLQLSLPEFPAVSPVDSPLVAKVAFEGVANAGDNTLSITLLENSRTLDRKTVTVPVGYFKKEVFFRLDNALPGRHLYRFNLRSIHTDRESLSANAYTLHSKVPKQLCYSLYNSRPTLDRRFIQLCLKRQRFFVESPSGTTHNPDLLVLFDWDHDARQLFNTLKPGGLAVFIGTLPCSTASIRSVSRMQLMRPYRETGSIGPFEDVALDRLPLPKQITYCKSSTLPRREVFLAAVLQDKPLPDTLDLVFTGRFNNRNYLACAAGDLWRWDFLPLSIEPDENRIFAFSERLISFSKEMLVSALSDELFLYPESELTESDSLGFRMVLPAGLPVPSDVKASCTFTSAQKNGYDTAFIVKSAGTSKQSLWFKPLPCGSYKFSTTAASNNHRYQFSDSIFIEEDRSEYMVDGQNTALLQEIAQPISDFSLSSLKNTFFNASEISQPVKKAFPLNRSWPLLLLIFAVFAAELILRRVLKLD